MTSVRVPPAWILFRSDVFPLVVRFLSALGAIELGDLSDLRATSWWRDAETNRRVGGHPESQHLLGLALDVTGPTLDLGILAARARGVGLTAVLESNHLHVQMLPAGRARARGLFSV